METIREPILKVVTGNESLTLVQITDLHLAFRYVFKDFHLFRLRNLLRAVHPDIVVNTGDLFCKRVFFSPMPLIERYMKQIGNEWPWAFAWGNHDLETGSRHIEAVDRYLDESPRALYQKSQDFFAAREGRRDISFYGNCVIEIFKKNSDRVKPAWMLFVFNTGIEDHVHPVVRDWARERCAAYGYSVPSICFMHRPIHEMRTRVRAGFFIGVSNESVGCGSDDGAMHGMFREMRTVKGCFFGHDHSNSFHCAVDGITYTASRKSLSLSYGAESVENFVRGKNPGRKKVQWGVTVIRLSMVNETAEAWTALEGGSMANPFFIAQE